MRKLPTTAIDVESTLKSITTVLLWLGIIGSIAYTLSISFVEVPGYYHSHSKFSFVGFCTGAGCLLEVIVAWAVLRVFVEISISLKKLIYISDRSFIMDTADVDRSKIKVNKKTGRRVYCYYESASGNIKYYKDLETQDVVSVSDADLEDLQEVTKEEIESRPKLVRSESKLSSSSNLKGLVLGQNVIVDSINEIGVVKAVTEDGNVIVETNGKLEIVYYDDIKEFDK